MSQRVIDHYLMLFVRNVRDETLRRIAGEHRANYVADPNDPFHRTAYYRLLRSGIPEAAIPAVLESVIGSVDRALELALFEMDQLRVTGRLRVSVREASESSRDAGAWVDVSNEHLTWENFIPFVEESAEIRSAADLDALVRNPPAGPR